MYFQIITGPNSESSSSSTETQSHEIKESPESHREPEFHRESHESQRESQPTQAESQNTQESQRQTDAARQEHEGGEIEHVEEQDGEFRDNNEGRENKAEESHGSAEDSERNEPTQRPREDRQSTSLAERGASNNAQTYDCPDNNPCTRENYDAGKFTFPHRDNTKYVECNRDVVKQCRVSSCPENYYFNSTSEQCEFRP